MYNEYIYYVQTHIQQLINVLTMPAVCVYNTVRIVIASFTQQKYACKLYVHL